MPGRNDLWKDFRRRTGAPPRAPVQNHVDVQTTSQLSPSKLELLGYDLALEETLTWCLGASLPTLAEDAMEVHKLQLQTESAKRILLEAERDAALQDARRVNHEIYRRILEEDVDVVLSQEVKFLSDSREAEFNRLRSDIHKRRRELSKAQAVLHVDWNDFKTICDWKGGPEFVEWPNDDSGSRKLAEIARQLWQSILVLGSGKEGKPLGVLISRVWASWSEEEKVSLQKKISKALEELLNSENLDSQSIAALWQEVGACEEFFFNSDRRLSILSSRVSTGTCLNIPLEVLLWAVEISVEISAIRVGGGNFGQTFDA